MCHYPQLIGGGKRVVLPTSFCLDRQTISAMEWEDRCKHLGVLLSPNPEVCPADFTVELKANTEKNFQFGLADWMKLEPFKKFVVPKLDYVLRSTLVHKKWAKELDLFIRRTVKQLPGLPGQTCDFIFCIPTAQGGLGLRSIVDDLDRSMITQAVRMLTSLDLWYG